MATLGAALASTTPFVAGQSYNYIGSTGTTVSSNTSLFSGTGGSIYINNNASQYAVFSNSAVFPAGLRLLRLGRRIQIGQELLEVGAEDTAALEIVPGQETILKLPDDTYIWLNDKGGYKIYHGKDGKITYKANTVREFNRFLNASDLLEQFIRDLGHVGVKQDEVLEIPVGLFINWLIIKSAEQDQEPIPKDVPSLKKALQSQRKGIKCKCCGKFISEDRVKLGLTFCNADHYSSYEKRLERHSSWQSFRGTLARCS
jgi:hypothetical protein